MGPTFIESAIMLNEMYVSFVEAGFSEEQSLELVKAALVASIGGGNAEVQDS